MEPPESVFAPIAGKDFQGRQIKVEIATRKIAPGGFGGRGGSRDGRGERNVALWDIFHATDEQIPLLIWELRLILMLHPNRDWTIFDRSKLDLNFRPDTDWLSITKFPRLW